MNKCAGDTFWSRFVAIAALLLVLCGTTYAQNSEAAMLEEKIKIYNRDFCPPRAPINEISDLSLLKLVTVELLERDQMERFRGMELVDGRVVRRVAASVNAGNAFSGNNLAGDLEASGVELKNKNTRGHSAGNKKPEKLTKLKVRKVTYRDRDNQLREMEVYSPPKIKAKKNKKVKGKKGKKVKDYAASRLLPKNADKDDSGKFDRMPSPDSWIDDD